MNVVFCQPTLNRSGSEKSLLQLLRTLKDQPEISSLRVLAGQDGVMRTEFQQYADVYVLNAPKLRRSFKGIGAFLWSFVTMYRSLKFHLQQERSVVYVNTLMFPQAAIAGYLNKKPVVVHIREVATTYPAGVYRLYMLIAGFCAARLVAPCGYVFRQKQIPRLAAEQARQDIIYNAASGHTQHIKRSLKRPYRILAVIPCTVRKGVLDLVKCVKYLTEVFPEPGSFRVDVVGTLDEGRGTLDRVKRALKEDGTEAHVRFHGEVDDVKQYLLDAHVLLHPSHSECFPRVLVEAFGYSLPCVTTNVGGIPELVRDSVNGYLVPVGASEEMARRLFLLLSDSEKYEEFARRAFETFQTRYTLVELCRQSTEVLKKVVRDHQRS